LGIADEISDSTKGAVRLGPGTLYRSLKEMIASGLIEEASAPRGDDDPRRKFYRLTRAGRTAARLEAERYSAIVELARRRDVIPRRHGR
jgi:DNA-binding PadR family transcriptional regulator